MTLQAIQSERFCDVCRKPFMPANTFQTVCRTYACARKVPILARKVAKADRQQTRARLDAMKTRSQYIAEAQTVVNRYARFRDIHAGYGCISCPQPYQGRFGGAFDAGHMLSRGAYPQLRFRLDNLALQCVKDNRYLGGNAAKFRAGMIERHGLAKVEALEANHEPAKWSIDYLKRLKRIFAKKARRMEKRIRA